MFSAIVLIFFIYLAILKNEYGSVYQYFDIKFHPEKYSYNCFVAKSLTSYDYKNNNNLGSVYYLIEKLDKKHRNQKNVKSKEIIKYLDLCYDTYRAILSGQFKNAYIVKFNNIEDYKKYPELRGIIFFTNIIIPTIESDKELKIMLKEKNNVRKILEKEYKTSINPTELCFFDFSNNAKFFLNFDNKNESNYKESVDDEFEKLSDDFIRKILDKYTKQELKAGNADREIKEYLFDGQFYRECSNLMYKKITELFKEQYVALGVKNKNKYIYKIKALRGGNSKYWEYVEISNQDEQFNLLVGNISKRAQEFEKQFAVP